MLKSNSRMTLVSELVEGNIAPMEGPGNRASSAAAAAPPPPGAGPESETEGSGLEVRKVIGSAIKWSGTGRN